MVVIVTVILFGSFIKTFVLYFILSDITWTHKLKYCLINVRLIYNGITHMY